MGVALRGDREPPHTLELTYCHFNTMEFMLYCSDPIVLPDLTASACGPQSRFLCTLNLGFLNLGSSKSKCALVCTQRRTVFFIFSLALQRLQGVRECTKILDPQSIPTPAQTMPVALGGWSLLLPTHLHEGPVVVHLLGSLEKVAPIRPHGRVLLRDDSCA